MSEKQLNITADDMVGILIHNANQIASVLGVHGVNANWFDLAEHLARMQQITAIAAAHMQAVRAGAAQSGESAPN